jgi:hypothetical protein
LFVRYTGWPGHDLRRFGPCGLAVEATWSDKTLAFTIAKFIANETDKNEKNKAKEHQEDAESGCKRNSKFHDGLT